MNPTYKSGDLVDTGSFSRAAESNFISQSAVSQQLAKLERELGVQLINRGGGLVEPTAPGRAYYDGASQILRRYEQLVGEVRSADGVVRGVLRVGTIYSVGFYLLDPLVQRFLHEHPEVNLHVTYTGWNQISAAVISGQMDLGVVACPETNRSLDVVPLADEELMLVCPRDHALAERDTICPSDLEGQDIIAFEPNVPTRRLIDRLLKKHRTQLSIRMEFDNAELLKRAVMVGAGVAILPKESVKQEASRGDLVCTPFDNPKEWRRPVAVIRRRSRSKSPAEKLFFSILTGGE